MKLLGVAVLCIWWGMFGFVMGKDYQEQNQFKQKHYIYKKTCFTIKDCAVLEYECKDSTLESE